MATETGEKVPDDIIGGLMAVRATATVNMFDRKGVIEVAESIGHDDTADWMRDKANRSAYVAWLTCPKCKGSGASNP